MQVVRSRFRDHIHDGATGAAELDPEIARLHRHFLDRVGHVEGLRDTGEGYVVILSAVEQKIIRANALAIHRKRRVRAFSI